MKETFKNILDDDENIIKTFKPNKLKFYFPFYLTTSLFLVVIIGTIIYLGVLYEMKISHFILASIGVFALTFLITIYFVNLTYEKRVYAYSNKRILIQSGLIGIDYKSLDHEMIGATEVRVDFLDKLLNKDTGTIKFGSKASPMEHGLTMFLFSDIEDPYNVYREVKKYIDEVKKSHK